MKSITIKLTAALLLFVVVGSTNNSINMVSAMDISAASVEAEASISHLSGKKATAPASLIHHMGTVKFFNENKGFGFIVDEETHKEFFVHVTGLIDTINIKEGDAVQFDTAQGKGGLVAVNVTVIG